MSSDGGGTEKRGESGGMRPVDSEVATEGGVEAHCLGPARNRIEVRPYTGAEEKSNDGACGSCGNTRRSPRPASHPRQARKLYTLDQLTRALAETDPELVAIATKRTEGDPARLERCLATAVERDEAGARTRAEKLVERAREGLEMNYAEFIERKTQAAEGDGFEPVWLPEFLLGFPARSSSHVGPSQGPSGTLRRCGHGKDGRAN